MKKTSKMMVIAAVFLVAAAMLVLPASAARVNASDAIESGDTIFVYEEDLTFSSADFPALSKLAYYSDFQSGSPDTTIETQGQKLDELLKSEVGSDTGLYYGWDASGLIAGNPNVNIKMPDVSVDVKLVDPETGKVTKDSLNGKTVTKNTQVQFEITSNIGTAFAGSEGTPYTVNLKVKTPDGGEIFAIGDSGPLVDIPLDGSKVYTKTISLQDIQTTGTYTITGDFPGDSPFDGDVSVDSVKFDVSTKDIAIESNKESVVRNNAFVVTITGDSKTPYYVYIKRAAGTDLKQYPWIADYQSNVDNSQGAYDKMEGTSIGKELAGLGTAAIVTTGAGGTRTVEFNTNSSTKDTSFTVKVYDPTNDKDDDVKVKIEEGEVTLTAEGAGKYYLGEEIKLTGTNTDSEKVYLFMTGPNLGTDGNGVPLNNIKQDASDGDYTEVSVDADDTWEYRWNTAATDIGGVLDSGAYTVYAVSGNESDDGKYITKGNLRDVKYQSIGLYLKKPFLTLDNVASRVAKGDELKVTGVAEGSPDDVQIWIFGKNYRDLGIGETVEDDGTFEYTLERADTDKLTSGQYFLIVQHPMTDGDFNVFENAAGNVETSWGPEVDVSNLPASEAATAVIDLLNSPNCDDTYSKVSFQIEEARIDINAIGDQKIGTKFTISGTTNLAVGDELSLDVTGASFKPSEKTQASGFSGTSAQVIVEAGDDYNKWSYEVDATDFKPDQYTVTVESVDADISTSQTFNVFESDVTITPTETAVTETVTSIETTTSVPPTTETPAPGFGALVALIGLGAVAFLVMRRH